MSVFISKHWSIQGGEGEGGARTNLGRLLFAKTIRVNEGSAEVDDDVEKEEEVDHNLEPERCTPCQSASKRIVTAALRCAELIATAATLLT